MHVSEFINPMTDASYAGTSVAYTGTAGSTSVYPRGPEGVVVCVTSAAYVSVGVGVTATSADTYVPANTMVKFKIPDGTGAPWRVSAVQVAAGGTLYVKPIALE